MNTRPVYAYLFHAHDRRTERQTDMKNVVFRDVLILRADVSKRPVFSIFINLWQMDWTGCSETSARRIQMPGNNRTKEKQQTWRR